MSAVIRIEQVSKVYRLGDINRKVFMEELKKRWGGEGEPPPEIWALRDVNFTVNEGDVIGVIGRNGSGKSTLLKILSRITAPSSGRVLIKGRVASLLEVGTGFHQDLTGRDNVFLNGVILGMSHQEVARKYDEIVAFADVESFMDTPVKHYSSGMRMRLAFAVAAHLEPEILVIDEVLAVGDQTFQQKCLGKIGEVARAGRTVLFVSHNAAAVESLCTSGLVLDHGRLVFAGTQTEAIHYYAHQERPGEGISLRDRTDRQGNGELRVTAIELRDASGQVVGSAVVGKPIEVWLYFENPSRKPWNGLMATIMVKTEFESPVFIQQNRLTGDRLGELPERGALVCRIPRLPLPVSTYRLGFALGSESRGGVRLDAITSAIELPVISGDFFGTGELPHAHHGPCLVEGAWRLETGAPTPVPEVLSVRADS